jgi:glycine betaine/choline ABC-type transport system substrate-binding protein
MGEILGRLEGMIDDVTMLELNHQVDVNGKLPAEVVRDFLVGADLLKNGD